VRSWDRFQVPFPLARGVFVYGDPIDVPAGADRDAMEAARSGLERTLLDLTRRAEELAGALPETPEPVP